MINAGDMVETHYFSPVFLYLVEKFGRLFDEVRVVNIHDHIPGPLFPDARVILSYLLESLKTGKSEIGSPVWLNGREALTFQLSPRMGLLMRSKW